MTAWWANLTARERSLFALAGGLALALAFFQFALVPLHDKRARALSSYAEASAVLEEVRDGVARVTPGEARVDSGDGLSLRASLTTSAIERGLAIARVQPLDDGGLSVRLDSADPELLYAWLISASEATGARVRQATLRRNSDGGGVQATLIFEEGRS